MQLIIAHKQAITQIGMRFLAQQAHLTERCVDDKVELIEALKKWNDAIVVLDYTLFDINDAAELTILCQRFPKSQWILFSDELSLDFVKTTVGCLAQISIVLKDASLAEIKEALSRAMKGDRYVCQRVVELLLAPPQQEKGEENKLTKTETEILKEIALGFTTREIAEKRFSSFHTINTHRKNIFRKLGVNNVHEATKYALRAGVIDSAEYYI